MVLVMVQNSTFLEKTQSDEMKLEEAKKTSEYI